MVSGFVTSPCDQLRIFSGEARLMRMASKSAIGFAKSKGLERNKVSSTSHGLIAAASGSDLMARDQLSVASNLAEVAGAWQPQLFLKSFFSFRVVRRRTNWQRTTAH
jgi:hypothetical protein